MNLSKALECPLTIGLWLAAPVVVGVRRDMLVRDMLIGTEDCKNLDSVFLKLGSKELYSTIITDRINKVGSLISDTPGSM